MVACAKEAEAAGSYCYGIITSGTGMPAGKSWSGLCGRSKG